MPHSARTNDCVPDPLQGIKDDLQRRTSEAVTRAGRTAQREQLSERLTASLRAIMSFAGGLLAPEKHPRHDAFFVELACRLLALNAALNDADREYPRLRIRERLKQATQAGVIALDTATSLLLLDPAFDPTAVARDLENIQKSRPHNVWLLWLTYILDQALNSYNPPVKDNVPPDTTREEWRRAEAAFGCVLFSDESFRVLQESVDQAACQIGAALKSGGYPTLIRPPCRVRDLIAQFDARALHWYASDSSTMQLLQPPPSIETITEPQSLRRQLDEVWTAANHLEIALDKWAAWFVELQEHGDAHPALALNCSEMASRAIKVLLTHRPNIAPFDSADETGLLAMLPPIPAWWLPGTEINLSVEGGESIGESRIRWQEDREFLDRYYQFPEQRQEKAVKLRGAAAKLIDLLKSFPMSALATACPPTSTKVLLYGTTLDERVGVKDAAPPTPTIGIITALPHETAAVRAVLGEPRRIDVVGSGAGRAYWLAELPSLRGGIHHVVIAQADIGNNLAAHRAGFLLSHFPKVDVIMCGIAGGIPYPFRPAEHVRLGDIVVSSQKGVVQYDFVKRKIGRKRTEVPEEIRASPHRPSSVLLEAVRILEANMHLRERPWEVMLSEVLARLFWVRPDASTDVLADTSKAGKIVPHPEDAERRQGQPRVFLGPIGSANTLLKDPAKRDALRDQFGVKAVEMEGSGIQDATWIHGVGYLVVRGICDYCDANKNDLWQKYAAVAAAAYVRVLLESMPGAITNQLR